MPPRFSLQPVLDFRHSRVETLEIELAKLQGILQHHQDILEKLQDLVKSLEAELIEKQTGVVDLFAVQHIHSNIHLVEDNIAKVKVMIADLEKKVALKQEEMIAAKQGEETLKTLKDKEIQKYQSEQLQMENRQIDDVYISQAYRNRQSGEVY